MYTYCTENLVVFIDPSGLRLKIDDNSRTSTGNVSLDEIQTVVDSMNILLCGEANIFIDRYGVLHLRDVVEGAGGAGYNLINELISSAETISIGIVNEKTAAIYNTGLDESSKYDGDLNLIKFNENVQPNTVIGFTNVIYDEFGSYGMPIFAEDVDVEKRRAISLGHEMIHALRDIRGLYLGAGQFTTYSGTRPAYNSGFLWWAKVEPIKNNIDREEFMTVGLIEWNGGNKNRITENDLRKQLGLDIRRWY